MLIALAAAMLLAGAASAPAAPGKAPDVITEPDWLKKPDMDRLNAVWPLKAARQGLGGSVKLSCAVNVHGLLENCSVVSESPSGMGFGAAALQLAPNFQMKPMTRNGVPERGGTVQIPINFVVPGGGSIGVGERMTIIAHPIWAAAPGFADVDRAYPKKGNGVSGHVVARCSVEKDGRLDYCTILSEDPAGHGFADAAETLTRRFRLRMDPALQHIFKLQVDLAVRLADPSDPEVRKRHIGEPTWIATPDPERLATLFPAKAGARGIMSGRGVANCAVQADGSLADCRPDPTDPPGLGFSEAAVQVAESMKMNPWTDEGGPVDGATIELPVRFERPEASKP